MKTLFVIAALCVSMTLGSVRAAEKSRDVVKAETKEAFAAAAADVRQQMGADGRYAYVKADERAKVETSLDEMSALFDANGSVDKMDKATKVRLFNAQETVNSILTLRDRDRLICERGLRTGSRIVTTSCRTYGDLEAARQASAKFMNERAVTPCNAPSCVGK